MSEKHPVIQGEMGLLPEKAEAETAFPPIVLTRSEAKYFYEGWSACLNYLKKFRSVASDVRFIDALTHPDVYYVGKTVAKMAFLEVEMGTSVKNVPVEQKGMKDDD